MSFHSPHLLWVLVPLVLLFSWELARHTARAATTFPKIARAWAGAFNVSLGAQHTTAETRPRIWLWFGLALCIVALARPQWGVIEEQVFDQSREVLIAVDLSKSMLAQDVKPSRLDRSKLLIQSLLDGLKGERVGLVVFAGTAFLQSPLSADYEILREFLPSMGPDYLPEGGTNYHALIDTAIQAFGTSTADRYLIILSDGEATDDNWKPLVEQLKTKGIRIIGLGVGTAQGSFIPDSSGGFVKDERGAVVLARLNSSTLQELAQVTGGAYADASTWVDLSALLKKTIEAGKKGDFSEKNTARKIERFQWFLAPSFLLLLISFWAEFPVRPRERALPLGSAAGRKPKMAAAKTPSVAAVLLCVLWLSALGAASPVFAAEPTHDDTLSKPLATAVARVAELNSISAKDYAELAQTTVTYGQRAKSAQHQAPENVLRDALQSVDLGEALDAKAAEWPKLRQELQDLLKKEAPPKKDDQKKDDKNQDKKDQDKDNKDQQKQDQNKEQEQKNQDKNQQNQQDQDKQKSDQQKQDEKKQQEQNQPKDNQDAFGDLKDKQDKKAQPKPQPPPQPGTQKVGGQQEKKTEEQLDPELAQQLQKLEQVRNQDSPAKLQQIMQGQQQKAKPTGKDW